MAVKPGWTNRRGQLLVLAPMLFIILSLFLAIVIDIGLLVTTRARLQNTADASSLAAAQVLFARRVAGDEEEAARQVALAEGGAIQVANCDQPGFMIQFGTMSAGGTFVVADTGTAATVVRTIISRDQGAPGGPVAMFFAPLVGVEECDVAATATTQITNSIVGVYAGLSPFAVPRDRIPSIGDTMVFYPADPDGEGGGLGDDAVAPGCWGLLNLDGGSLGTPELVDWIENGYDGGIFLDPDAGHVWVDGTPGFRSALHNPMQAVVGSSFIMSVYDEVTGEGANGSFRVTGFLTATITGAQLVGQNRYVECRLDELSSLHDVLTGDTVPSPNVYKIQLIR